MTPATRITTFALVVIGTLNQCLLGQSCAPGTNQPYSLLHEGNYSAFPKFGARAYWANVWTAMTSSGIKYIYRDQGPNSGQCPYTGGGDFNFTGSQIVAMDTAFANWTSAKSANGSNLNFTRVYSTTYGSAPFSIEIMRMSNGAMPSGVSAQVTSGFANMDYNNDGIHDEFRLVDATIEVRQDVSTYMTRTMVHEIGHVMGLDDCNSCNATTIMGPYENGPTAPSSCDTARVLTMFP